MRSPLRVAVTGAAGFIGSNLVDFLLAEEIDVVPIDCLNNDLYSKEVKSRNWRSVQEGSQKKLELLTYDLSSQEIVSLLEGCTHLVNLAALPGQSNSWMKGEQYWINNVIVVQRLLEVCKFLDIRFIQASSSSVYGNLAIGREDQPKKPISPYGVTKSSAEDLIEAYIQNPWTVFGSVVLRFFSVYGIRQRPDMGIFKFIQKIDSGEIVEVYGDGHALRTITYVSDIVQTIWMLLNSKEISGTYNICGDELLSINEIISEIERVLNKKAMVTFIEKRIGDQTVTCGDSTKARKDFGFSPQVSFAEGIIKQVDWFKSLGEKATS